MKLFKPNDIGLIDKECINTFNIPEIILMEDAANKLSSTIDHFYKTNKLNSNHQIKIFASTGNNGGDALALARLLFAQKKNISIIIVGDKKKLKTSALHNYKIIKALGIPYIWNPSIEVLEESLSQLNKNDLVIDAFFGVGLNRPLSPPYSSIIPKINTLRKEKQIKVLSVDIPSGIDSSTGEIQGCAIESDFTLILGCPKIGNFLYPGFLNHGQLYLTPLSIPEKLLEAFTSSYQINLPLALPQRDEMGYKGSFGKIFILSGAKAYYGAPIFAGQAALRSGGGFVTLASPEDLIPSLANHCPELVFMPLNQENYKRDTLLKRMEEHDLVIIGPGLGRAPQTIELIRELLPRINKTLIIDGDGLFALASHPELTRERDYPTILTPHHGELCNLQKGFSKTVEEVYKAITLYKGPHSQIKTPSGKIFINITGNSGLGTPGSGDILAGIIGGQIVSSKNNSQALEGLRRAVALHGLLGDLAIKNIPKESLIASDLIKQIPKALQLWQTEYKKMKETCFNKIISI